MALAIRIEFYTRNSLEPAFIVEPHWWNANELLVTYPFTQRYMNGYLNDYLLLSKQQLAEMHAFQGENSAALVGQDKVTFRQMEEMINADFNFKKIQINIYEWDTCE